MNEPFLLLNQQTCIQNEHIESLLFDIDVEERKLCRDLPLPMCQVQSRSIRGRHSQDAATSYVISSLCWSMRMAGTYQTLSAASTACEVSF